MNFLSRLSIKIKILVIPVIAIIGFIAALAVNGSISSDNSARLAQIQDLFFPVVQSSRENIVRINRTEELLNTAVSTGEGDMIYSAESTFKELKSKLGEQKELWPDKAATIEELESLSDKYFQVAVRLSNGMINGDLNPEEMPSLVQKMNESLARLKRGLTELNEGALQAFYRTVEQSNEAATNAFVTTLILSLVAIAIIILISASVIMMITRNINTMLESLKDIASGEGDLTKRINQSSYDEIGDLVHWFNQFMNKLHESINEVVKSIQPLARVSGELGDMTNKSIQITDEQSRATDQVTQDVDDMFRSVQAVAQNASSAAEAAREADQEAKAGRSVVTQSVEYINDLAGEVERAAEVISKLEADTENVGTILDVIKGIAEQTNLLALNAAIEAARAGEQGRGFAVVADEVRTLASKTHESTEEIQRMIERLQKGSSEAVTAMETSQSGVTTSVDQITRIDEHLKSMRSSAESMRSMNEQIAQAISEQHSAIAEVNSNLTSIREVSDSTLEQTQSCKQKSDDLSAMSVSLKNQLAHFRTAQSD